MENKNFCYSAKQSAVASSSIISPPVEPEQDSQEISANIAQAPCPSCGSTRLNVVKMPDHCHFAAIRCGECDRFLKWQPEPKNLEIRQRRQTAIAALLNSAQLLPWERTFLEGLKGKKISPRQQEVLAQIEARVGGAR